jgi:nicotinamidase-related amidase
VTHPFPLRPTQQGLLVVDMQNDFVRQGAPQEVPEARKIIPTIRRLLDAFRESGRPVFYTRFLAGPNRTLMWVWSPECGEEMRSCWPGHIREYEDADQPLEGAAIVNELSPQPGEVIVDKYGYGGFHNTVLEDALRSKHIDQVVVTGTVTQICVEETVREGFHRNLEMVVIRDGVASFDRQLHEGTLKNLAMKFAMVTTAEEVMAAGSSRTREVITEGASVAPASSLGEEGA